jgi:hypothetical protein
VRCEELGGKGWSYEVTLSLRRNGTIITH